MRRVALVLLLVAACKPAVDFDQGRPYACTSDGDCATGWRCGLEGVCHQQGVGAPYQCRYGADAGINDCEAGWQCGVAGRCLDPSVPGPNACNSDLDCFGGWRCAFGGVCHDPTTEALGLNGTDPGPLQVIHPLVAQTGPDQGLVAASANTVPSYLLASQGTLQLLIQDGSGAVTGFDAGASAGVASVSVTGTTGYFTTATDLFTVRATTGVRQVLQRDGTAWGPGWQLRTTDNLFGDVAVFRPSTGDLRVVTGLRTAVASTPATSPPFVDAFTTDRCGYLVRDTDLVATDLADGGSSWQELAFDSFTSSHCGTGPADSGQIQVRTWARSSPVSPPTITVAVRTSPRMTVADSGVDVGPWAVSIYDLTTFEQPDADGGRACARVNAACQADAPRLFGPCLACQSGSSLVDFHPTVSGLDRAIEAECSNNGTVSARLITQDAEGTCIDTPLTGASPRFHPRVPLTHGFSNPASYVTAGTHGELWAGHSLGAANPMFLERPPQGFFSLADDAGVGAFVSELVAVADPTWGFAVRNPGFTVVAWVANTSSEVVTGDRRLGILSSTGLKTLGLVAVDDVDFLPPYFARRLVRPDGGTEHLVVSADSIYGASLPDAPTPGPTPLLTLKLVPQSGSLIGSMVLLPGSADSGNDFEGYVLTQTGLFSIAQSSDDGWSANPVGVPSGTRVAIWAESGKKARLGYANGVVYSLPSLVLLSKPLTGAHVQQYQRGCGWTWALTESGLYRLVAPADGGLGTWERTALGGGEAFSDDALYTGRIHAFGGKMYISNRYGGTASFVPVGGCPVN